MRQRKGEAAIGYALLIGLIGIAALAAITDVGNAVSSVLTSASTQITGAANQARTEPLDLTVDGVGSADDSFASIQAAIDAATPGSTVTVEAGSYECVTIDKPLTLVGSGGPTASCLSFHGIHVTSDDVSISGVNVTGSAGHGVLAENANNFSLSNVELSNNSGAGAVVNFNSPGAVNVSVSQVTARGNTAEGIDIRAFGGAMVTGSVTDFDLGGDSAANGNGSHGISLRSGDSGSSLGTQASPFEVQNGSALYNGSSGVLLLAEDDSSQYAELTGINASFNGENGFLILTRDTAFMDVVLSGSDMSDNIAFDGARIRPEDQSQMFAQIDGNTASRNGRHGIQLLSRDSSQLGSALQRASVTNNTTNDNGQSETGMGVQVKAGAVSSDSASTIHATASGNNATGNSGTDLDLCLANFGTCDIQ